MTLFTDARLVLPDAVVDRGWLRTDGARIAAIGTGEPPPTAGRPVPLDGAWLVPGFVDLHCHGGGGASYQDGPAQARAVAAFHRRHGTTTSLASIVTALLPEMEEATARLAALVDDGVIAGVHLEGPFLSAARCGAHVPALLREPEPEVVDRLLAAGRGAVRMVTLAPELPGAERAVRQVVAAGAIAAVGHTDADHAQTRRALEAGARVGTHVFNGMAPLHHREPGPVLALLERDDVTVEVVADGVHLHPSIVAFLLRAVPDRVAFVTDAMAAAGMPDGTYRVGPATVVVSGGTARLADGSSIAGSTATMDAAVRWAVAHGVPLPRAVAAASLHPARALGLDDRTGSLAEGKDADLVVLDDALEVRAVMARGQRVHGALP